MFANRFIYVLSRIPAGQQCPDDPQHNHPDQQQHAPHEPRQQAKQERQCGGEQLSRVA
jgi:hypothetical protein